MLTNGLCRRVVYKINQKKKEKLQYTIQYGYSISHV